MRKLLLATAALTIAGAGSALASGSAQVTVSTTLAELCSLSQPSNIVLSGTNVGANGSSNFSVTCNFGGTGNTPMTVTLSSLNGGVSDGTNVVDYTIAFESGTAAASVAKVTPLVVPSSSGAANVATPKSFSATLLNPVTIAGTYSDTVTVAVAP